MKLTGVNALPGEFASKALIRSSLGGWWISPDFYFSLEEAKHDFPHADQIKWPIEVYDDSFIYVPDKSELE